VPAGLAETDPDMPVAADALLARGHSAKRLHQPNRRRAATWVGAADFLDPGARASCPPCATGTAALRRSRKTGAPFPSPSQSCGLGPSLSQKGEGLPCTPSPFGRGSG
jgi:hypothetical protein